MTRPGASLQQGDDGPSLVADVWSPSHWQILNFVMSFSNIVNFEFHSHSEAVKLGCLRNKIFQSNNSSFVLSKVGVGRRGAGGSPSQYVTF